LPLVIEMTWMEAPAGGSAGWLDGGGEGATCGGLGGGKWPLKRQISTISANFKFGREQMAPRACICPCTSSFSGQNKENIVET